MCDERDLCQMFDYLHLLEGLEQGATVTDCAMIGHKDGVMARNQRFKCIGQFRCARGAVASQRNRAQSDDNLAHQRTVQIVSGRGKAGGCRWVCVNDAIPPGAR